MIFEVCSDSLETVQVASRYGIKRAELCSALSVGGLTPSLGLVEACAKVPNIEVHTMLRHREGNFVYNLNDQAVMLRDIEQFAGVGAKGVVFGILDEKGQVSPLNQLLVERAKSLGLEATFHRAFDFTAEPLEAIQQLLGYGFTRLLTSGTKAKAIDGLDLITKLNDLYGDQIQIMAGSGVSPTNAKVFEDVGIDNLHFTAHLQVGELPLGMGLQTATDEEKIKAITGQFI